MKKLVLLVFTVIYSSFIWAQTWEELANKSIQYEKNGDYTNAIEFGEKAKTQAENEFGIEHDNYITSLNNLAVLYNEMANYLKAEQLYIEVIDIIKKIHGTDYPNYATSLNNLAELYTDMGLYKKAESLHLEALNIRKKVLNPDHPNYISSLNNLGVLYFKIGNYSKAESYFTEALSIKKRVLGPEHPDYATTLDNLAVVYYMQANYIEAEQFYNEALSIRKKTLGTENTDYAGNLNNLAALYFEQGNFTKAEPLFLEALNIRKKIFGTNHPDYAQSLNNLAGLYKSMEKYAEVEKLYIEALRIMKKVFGTNHPNYANSLNNLASFYKSLGSYSKAEPLYIEALNIKWNVTGSEHADYAESLNNLAELYLSMGNYSKAEPLYFEALNIRKKVFGQNHPNYAASLSNLATFYQNIGDYTKAELFYMEALNIRKKILGSNHPDYVSNLDNLSVFYTIIGNYSKAEDYNTESLNIRKKVLGTNNLDYANSLNTLASIHYTIGDYGKAESAFIESLNIRKQILGHEHPDYANSLDNLAIFYGRMGNYANAEALLIEASNIKKKVFGTDHPDLAINLNNLACIYSEMGNYSKAEPLYVEALNIIKKAFGTEHIYYANFLYNLAFMYHKMGIYKNAEPIYIECLNITKKILGIEYPDYANYLNNLAVLYDETGNYTKAEPLYIQTNDALNKQIEKNFTFLSEKEKEQFLTNNINYNFNIYNSFFIRRKQQNPAIVATSYNNELAHKGMLLQSNTALKQIINGSGNSELISNYDQLITIHKKLTGLYTQPIVKRKINVDSLENIANTLEKELLSKGKDLPNFENLMGLSKVKWEDVQQSLKPNEAAIEFINFQYRDKKWTDSTFYCALVLLKDYTYPKMIYLFEEKQLQKIFSTSLATKNENYITQLYSYKSNLQANQPATKNLLYQLIWQPIDSLLKGINTVYMAPSGLLHKVAFNAIPTTDSTWLSDKYNINLVSSTRVLTQTNKVKQPLSNNFKAVLYGGIVYDVDSAEMLTNSKHYQQTDQSIYSTRSINFPENIRGSVWKYLPGTLSEVNDIKGMFDSKQIPTTIVKDKQATEESFKYITDKGKSPDIIHIATHGFFFPEIKTKQEETRKVIFRSAANIETQNEPIFTYSENPLLRSGLLFAGANRIWNLLPPLENIEDGTLTAYEVSNMNLSNTQLVVLSACETGLGDVKGSEGVFGLQRAFKMAGVKYIMMSLWEIPDSQTSELMKLFYNNWLNGMNIKSAFNSAQNTMRKKYSPYYWAAFVLIE